MTPVDISLLSSFLAIGMSVGGLFAVRLVRRTASEECLRTSEEAMRSRNAAVEQFHLGQVRMQVQLEQSRSMLRGLAVAEVDRRLEAVIAAELRLRASFDGGEGAHAQGAAVGRRSRWEPTADFASTEPMDFTSDFHPTRPLGGAVQDLRAREAAETYAHLAARLQQA